MGRPKGSPNKQQRPKVKLPCPTCGESFYVNPSVVRHALKRGSLIYCSRMCSDQNKKNVWPAFGKDTSQWKDGRSSYRERAIRKAGYICQKCNYDGTRYPGLIWVHHKNFKPRAEQDDHSLDNLIVLCVRCHLEEHYAVSEQSPAGLLVEA